MQLPGGLGLGGARATKPPATCAGRLLALCCSCLPTLTYKQRLYGAGGRFVLGLLLSLLSLGSLVQLFLGNPLPFASKYAGQLTLARFGRVSRRAGTAGEDDVRTEPSTRDDRLPWQHGRHPRVRIRLEDGATRAALHPVAVARARLVHRTYRTARRRPNESCAGCSSAQASLAACCRSSPSSTSSPSFAFCGNGDAACGRGQRRVIQSRQDSNRLQYPRS